MCSHDHRRVIKMCSLIFQTTNYYIYIYIYLIDITYMYTYVRYTIRYPLYTRFKCVSSDFVRRKCLYCFCFSYFRITRCTEIIRHNVTEVQRLCIYILEKLQVNYVIEPTDFKNFKNLRINSENPYLIFSMFNLGKP